jgi:hypothetical protein
MGRSLPGILECGMWNSIVTSPNRQIAKSAPTFALITDIGNDVMYGATPDVITQWVEQCIDRLESHGASVAINPPPIESIRSVKRWQYTIVRSLLFPTRRLTFETALGTGENDCGHIWPLSWSGAPRPGVRKIGTAEPPGAVIGSGALYRNRRSESNFCRPWPDRPST